ncbi:putative ABC transporter permease subunit YbbP [Edwardsiella piscicida]|uniref:putative ABC transporter permease subunit YbbP n=1 Tax=Edwardsiella piscicida TaxID=1263550 RepID=UPI0009340F18|nr:putative ABC transporter permease subunit YbbP [Edwardsiella piscicida]EKS7812755.1 FtsX-like permease family protein [Edwardsiella piscicida]UCQ20398.1 FtsX-like permease family protein [Edwardsiella piscicida]WAM43973.1 FtsX-like permease family protein [Edwardsiella piscicida]
MIRRWFWREWRTPSLLIVWLALALAVACVLALGRIGDRLDQGLQRQGREAIAADRVLRSYTPVPEAWLAQARREGIRVSRQWVFSTMAFAGGRLQLAEVKAVDDAYPLYGRLETRPPRQVPRPGEALVAPRLMAQLALRPGDAVEVGDMTLRVVGEVEREPDGGFSLLSSAPRMLIALADAERSGIVQPGSRVSYRYGLAGSREALARYDAYLTPRLQADQRLTQAAQGANVLARTLQRAQQFLLLSALLTLLLAMAAVSVAMGHYCRSRHTLVALLKTLGAGRRLLLKWVVGQWLWLLGSALLVGAGLGLLVERGLLWLLTPLLPAALPSPGLWPWLWALGGIPLMALLAALRPYRQLLAMRPLRVLRADAPSPIWPLRYYLPLMALLLGGGLLWLVGASALMWSLLLGMALLALLLALCGWLGLWSLRRLAPGSLTLRLALGRLLRQPGATLSQLAAFSLSFMLLALLLMLRGDLLDRWRQQLPPDSPNYFLFNISAAQREPLQAFLHAHGVTPQRFYPIALARLTAINGRPPVMQGGDESLNRELNLTWLASLPPGNPLLAGEWPPGAGGVSVEQGVAERLGLTLGDRLTFSGDSRQFSARVTSLRRVDWESLRPNFYFIFPPGGLEGQPQSWLTSLRYDGDTRLLAELNRRFPTLTLVDMGALLLQARQILDQVGRALEVMVLLVVLCGVLLLLAQVQVGMEQRRQELQIYRILGASRRVLRRTLYAEFMLLGLAAGTVAAAAAEAALWLLQRQVFDFPWQPAWPMWLLLPPGAALLLGICGAGLGRGLLRRPSAR